MAGAEGVNATDGMDRVDRIDRIGGIDGAAEVFGASTAFSGAAGFASRGEEGVGDFERGRAFAMERIGILNPETCGDPTPFPHGNPASSPNVECYTTAPPSGKGETPGKRCARN